MKKLLKIVRKPGYVYRGFKELPLFTGGQMDIYAKFLDRLACRDCLETGNLYEMTNQNEYRPKKAIKTFLYYCESEKIARSYGKVNVYITVLSLICSQTKFQQLHKSKKKRNDPFLYNNLVNNVQCFMNENPGFLDCHKDTLWYKLEKINLSDCPVEFAISSDSMKEHFDNNRQLSDFDRVYRAPNVNNPLNNGEPECITEYAISSDIRKSILCSSNTNICDPIKKVWLKPEDVSIQLIDFLKKNPRVVQYTCFYEFYRFFNCSNV